MALTLGFGLPDNFKYPYAAIGFSDFWRRWHISLSTWLRDYLYIPLGGNRKGNLRTYANLMTTMLIGGLWHGASWTFVVWGGLHGIYLAVERWLVARVGHLNIWRKLPAQILLALVTYFFINITWVFFRAPDFETARRMIVTMLTFVTSGEKVLSSVLILQTVVTTTIMLAVHWWMRNRQLNEVVSRMPFWLTGSVWGIMLVLIIITQGGSSFTAGQDIPVSNLRITDGSVQSPLFNLPIIQNNDPLDGRVPASDQATLARRLRVFAKQLQDAAVEIRPIADR